MESPPDRGGTAFDHRELAIDLMGDEASPRHVEGESGNDHPPDDPDER